MIAKPSDDGAYKGQAIYSPLTLALYDFAVLAVSNSLIWRCPTKHILDLYNAHVTANHLDVGVGTGWYLDHCRFPGEAPRVGLLDMNQSSLAAASRRVARYNPVCYQANVLEPLPFDTPKFGSIGLAYLLHCLPGTMAEKAIVFDTLRPLLAPDGVMFGATILTGGVERSAAARALMAFYNRKGVFSNTSDNADGLERALKSRFNSVTFSVRGCVGLFACRP